MYGSEARELAENENTLNAAEMRSLVEKSRKYDHITERSAPYTMQNSLRVINPIMSKVPYGTRKMLAVSFPT